MFSRPSTDPMARKPPLRLERAVRLFLCNGPSVSTDVSARLALYPCTMLARLDLESQTDVLALMLGCTSRKLIASESRSAGAGSSDEPGCAGDRFSRSVVSASA